MPSRDELSFDLLQNAVDSILQAIEILVWPDSRSNSSRLKQALLSITHGIELLLKERLKRIHPCLIWEDVDRFPSIEARTVGLDKALHRLKNIGGLSFSDDELGMLRSLKRTRNSIEHYEWKTSSTEARVIAERALSFAIFFSEDQLSYDLRMHFKRDDTWEELFKKCRALVSWHEKRIYNANPNIRKQGLSCIYCGALTIPPQGGACELCGEHNYPDNDIPF